MIIKPLVIGIAGKKRAGKNTAADYLSDTLHLDTYAFADPIKEAAKLIFGWSEEDLYGDYKDSEDPTWGITTRHALQTLGTEWGRNMIKDDIWVTKAKHKIQSNRANNKGLIITDVRFDNEAKLIKSFGGVIINVIRNTPHHLDPHSSEQGINPNFINCTVENNQTKVKLYRELDKVIGTIHE